MDRVQDMIARWVRIIGAAGDGSTPLDEAVNQISVFGDASEKKSGLGRLKRNPSAPVDVPAVTVLSRQLVAGVLISDLLIDRLCALAGQTREQVLAQLAGDLPRHLPDQQLRVLTAELSDGGRLLQGPGPGSYLALGPRVEQLLSLAAEPATAIIDEARAEAARLASPAGTQPPGPRRAGAAAGPRRAGAAARPRRAGAAARPKRRAAAGLR
jgi:hypothetical protein